MTTEPTEAEAVQLGAAAFAEGRDCNPFLDPALADTLEAHPEVGGCLPLLRAWSRGWQAANLAAPIEEDAR